MDIERLRALEKAVELVAKATKGPWAFMNEKFDDCLLAFGTDSLEYDAPPPWYSCWTNINPDDGRALIAAVNFIREHGSALIAELGQEVGAVADAMTLSAPPKVWLQVDTDALEDSEREPIAREHWDQLTWCAESVGGHEVVYIREDLATSPAHTSEARDAARLDWLEKHGCWQFAGPSESDIRGPAYRWFDYDTDGHDYSATLREAIDAAIAAEAK